MIGTILYIIIFYLTIEIVSYYIVDRKDDAFERRLKKHEFFNLMLLGGLASVLMELKEYKEKLEVLENEKTITDTNQ